MCKSVACSSDDHSYPDPAPSTVRHVIETLFLNGTLVPCTLLPNSSSPSPLPSSSSTSLFAGSPHSSSDSSWGPSRAHDRGSGSAVAIDFLSSPSPNSSLPYSPSYSTLLAPLLSSDADPLHIPDPTFVGLYVPSPSCCTSHRL